MYTGTPLPSEDDKRIFVVTAQTRGELLRYDSASRQFIPYLSGASIEAVQLSPDREWNTYTSYPQGVLWKSKPDGSDPTQLTSPPLGASLPRWSPDGTRIAFSGLEPGKNWRAYVVSADGGSPERVVPGDDPFSIFPTWSPDGNSLLIGRSPGLEIVNLQTHTATKVPGSEGLFGPCWSPDGRHIVAIASSGHWPVLVDAKTQKWTALAKIDVSWPEWSHHSDYAYFLGVPAGGQQGIFRIRMSDRQLVQVVSLKDFRLAGANWVGLAPDDSPLVLRDTGTQDIYALHWEAP
jgi:Tol biopolymer transport system component